MNSSNPVIFTVSSQPLPSGWFDQDVDQVGQTGNASYSSGVFTVQGLPRQAVRTHSILCISR